MPKDNVKSLVFPGSNMTMSIHGYVTPRFRFLTGDVNFTEYGGAWVSSVHNNGDFNYRIVMALRNNWDYNESLPHYAVELYVVSPEYAGEDKVNEALKSMGLPDDFEITDLIKLEALYEYGISVQVWSAEGNNYLKLMSEARIAAAFVESYLGFYLDRPYNRLGATGWNALQGILFPGFGG